MCFDASVPTRCAYMRPNPITQLAPQAALPVAPSRTGTQPRPRGPDVYGPHYQFNSPLLSQANVHRCFLLSG